MTQEKNANNKTTNGAALSTAAEIQKKPQKGKVESIGQEDPWFKASLEHEPNAPSDAEQLDDVNNIAAMDPVTIPEDHVAIPEAMSELLGLLGTVDNASFRTTSQFH
jgi:hypothetical protein